MKTGTVDIGQQVQVEAPLPVGQTCALIADAGANTFRISTANCCATYSTSPSLHLCGSAAPALHFYVPPDTDEFELFIRTGNERETVRCQIISAHGQVMTGVSGAFPMRRRIAVEVPPSQAAGIWHLAIQEAEKGVFEDVRVSFGKQIPPYVSELATDLLLPANAGNKR